MIKFFRKIRQKLLTENKFSNYLLYAIGEIILVVIGILIALQINNWNIENADHKKEIIYLKSLKNEMESNLASLNKEEERISTFVKREQVLIKIMSSKEAIDTTSDKTIFNFYKDIFNTPLITNVETGAINEIISSGGLQYIKNDSIRKLVSSWDTRTARLKIQEAFLDETTKKIENLMFEEQLINTRYLFSLNESFEAQKLGEPIEEHSLKPLLKSEKYESHCILHYGQCNFMVNRVYSEYKTNLMGMIDLINKEIKK
jgi:hypothetical protein